MMVTPVGHLVRQAVHLVFVDEGLVRLVPRVASLVD
jgi:hypothetical protein